MTGLTSEQRALLEERWCPSGHRVDGVNYPTPEGICPLCASPELADQFHQYQRLLLEQSSRPRHQSIGLLEQFTSPSLTAPSER